MIERVELHILLDNCRVNLDLVFNTMFENLLLEEPRSRRNSYRHIAIDYMLTSEHFIIARLNEHGAFSTRALPAANGVENDTRLMGRIEQRSPGVDTDTFTIGLKNYGVMFHYFSAPGDSSL